VTPVQGDPQVQEADILGLTPDKFQSLLDSSDVDSCFASEGLEVDLEPLYIFL
jgi:hypothetical protein